MKHQRGEGRRGKKSENEESGEAEFMYLFNDCIKFILGLLKLPFEVCTH